MWERYTDLAKRAVFFAIVRAIASEVSETTSADLLAGLLFGEDSRAQTIFQLRERFPYYRGCPSKLEQLPDPLQPLPLTDHCKMILAWADTECRWMSDYWLDTEHLLLGILRVRQCTAAHHLAKAGLSLETARQIILDNKPSRPQCGPVPRWWRVKNRLFTMALLGQTP